MLARMHPADIAQVILHLSSPNEKRTVFELVRGEAQRGQVLSELDPGTIQHTLADLAPADVAWMLKDLGADDVTYILGVLPEEQAKEILTLMRTEDSTQIADLLKYPKDTSGGISSSPTRRIPPPRRRSDGYSGRPTRRWSSTSTSRIRRSIWSVCCRSANC